MSVFHWKFYKTGCSKDGKITQHYLLDAIWQRTLEKLFIWVKNEISYSRRYVDKVVVDLNSYKTTYKTFKQIFDSLNSFSFRLIAVLNVKIRPKFREKDKVLGFWHCITWKQFEKCEICLNVLYVVSC